ARHQYFPWRGIRTLLREQRRGREFMEEQSHSVWKPALHAASGYPSQPLWFLRRRSDHPERVGRQDLYLWQLRGLSFPTDDYFRKSRAVAAPAQRNRSDSQCRGRLPGLQPEQHSGDSKWRYVPAGDMFQRSFLRSPRDWVQPYCEADLEQNDAASERSAVYRVRRLRRREPAGLSSENPIAAKLGFLCGQVGS